MGRYHLSTTHLWAEQQVSVRGRTFFQRQCQVCDRNFVRPLDDEEWRPVHTDVLSFDFLDDETTQRWVSEDCPGRPLSWEANSERINPEGEDRPVPNAEPVVEENPDLEGRVAGTMVATGEVSELLKVHPPTVRKMAKCGKLPAFQNSHNSRPKRDPYRWVAAKVRNYLSHTL